MATCPVCEHAQEGGGECAVCGRHLAGTAAPEGAIERMQDLEPTRLEVPAALPVATLEGLEPTLQLEPVTPVAAAVDEAAAWIERTAQARDAPGGDLLAPPVCRYCRTPGIPGELFCARCGLKLAVYHRADPGAAGAGQARRCRFCGFTAPGEACPACGARFAVEA